MPTFSGLPSESFVLSSSDYSRLLTPTSLSSGLVCGPGKAMPTGNTTSGSSVWSTARHTFAARFSVSNCQSRCSTERRRLRLLNRMLAHGAPQQPPRSSRHYFRHRYGVGSRVHLGRLHEQPMESLRRSFRFGSRNRYVPSLLSMDLHVRHLTEWLAFLQVPSRLPFPSLRPRLRPP